MSKKIIVPQGLISPNETTIIEIPEGVGSQATLIARASPTANRSGNNRRNLTIASAHPANMNPNHSRMAQRPHPHDRSGGSGGGHRRVRTTTSTTIVHEAAEDPDSLGLLDERQLNSTFGSPGNVNPQMLNSTADGSLGILGSGYFDSTRATDPSSLGILGSGYFDSTRNTEPSSLGILGPGYMDSTRSTNRTEPSSLGILGPGYFDSTRNSSYGSRSRNDTSSLGVLGPGYFDSTRTTDPSSLGILGPGYMDSTRNTTDPSSLGILGPGYFDSTRSSGQSPRRTVRTVTRRVVTETPSQTARRQMRPGPAATSTPSKNRPCGCPANGSFNVSGINNSRSNSRPGRAGAGSQINLSEELRRHLDILEQNEQEQINRDLQDFQQARRRLMSRTATISSGENTQ